MTSGLLLAAMMALAVHQVAGVPLSANLVEEPRKLEDKKMLQAQQGCKLFTDENADDIPTARRSGERVPTLDRTVAVDDKEVTAQRAVVEVGRRITRRCRENTTFADGAPNKTFTCVDSGLWDAEDVCKQDHYLGLGRTSVGPLSLNLAHTFALPTASLAASSSSSLVAAFDAFHLNGSDPYDYLKLNTLNLGPESTASTF